MPLVIAGIFVSLTLLLCQCTGQLASCNQRYGHCTLPWKKWSGAGSCYRITPKPLPYDDAREACRKLGGEMAAPHSDQENDFMASLAPGNKIWIACTDRSHEGEWECEGSRDGEGIYTNWAPGEPNNHDGNEHCAMIKYVQWNDARCERTTLAVCRRQPYARCFTTNDEGRLDADSCP